MNTRSPFPGMDPYLERHWRDVHARLIHDSCTMLQRQLGGNLRARIDERLIVERDDDARRSIYPDVRVYEGTRRQKSIAPETTVATAEPLVVRVPVVEEFVERFVQIIDNASGGRVVSLIEFLSPSNKLGGEARRKYIEKQQETLASDANLVEIDLVRAGQRILACPEPKLPVDWRRDNAACVWRAVARDEFELYRFPLREKLPAIRIPLRVDDPDVVLDLQSLIDIA